MDLSDHAANSESQPEALSAKRIFTTGEAAAICKVSQQTIIRCFDAGRLTGFRVPGSKFRRIPRDELLRFMKTSGIPTDALGNPSGAHDERRRVLIVDDDDAFLRLAEHALCRGGFEVRCAATGYDAGLLTESFRPDAIVLDLMLPDVSGSTVCARVRAREDLRNCRILGVTASANETDIRAMSAAGIDAMLLKPFEPSALLKKVQDLFQVSTGTVRAAA
ncbi:MAG: response regulator [Phycisphaeraceae bacterium]|nr:response regulator [Phycisphaeraceae bacterium]